MRPLDIFVAVNLLLFAAMCVFTYYARFVQYRGAANIHEFFLYAAVLVSGILLLWRQFRHVRFDPLLLAMVQAGILAHFAGAFVQWDGHRLYDYESGGLRYDKLVHFLNAFIALRVVAHITVQHGYRRDGLMRVLMALTVLGLGAVVEVVEYLVVRTVPGNGVGGYDNNMQDLIANGVGTLVSVLTLGLDARSMSTARRLRVVASAGRGGAAPAGATVAWTVVELATACTILLSMIWIGPAVLPRTVFPFAAVAMIAAGIAYAVWVSPVLVHRDPLPERGLGDWTTWFVRTDNLHEAARQFLVLTLGGAVAIFVLSARFNPDWAANADWRAWLVRLGFYATSATLQAIVFVGFVVVRLRTLLPSRVAVACVAGVLFGLVHAPNPLLVALTAIFAAAAAWISVRTPNVLAAAGSQLVLGLLLHRALGLTLRVGYFASHPDLHVFREAVPVVGRIIGGLY